MAKTKAKSRDSQSDVTAPEPRVPIGKGASDKKRRKTARTIAKAQVGRVMWENEKKEMAEFTIPSERISYADDRDDANRMAADAIKDISQQEGDSLVGFDTEGSIKVLQLFYSFEGREYAQIYQLNKIIVDGRAPEKLIKLLTLDEIVFSGKKVNDEIIDVLGMCGVKEEDVAKARIIEAQRCFEVIEMVAKGIDKAHQYLVDGIYSPSYSLPKNPFVSLLKQRQEDLGLKTIYQFFYPQSTISKLLEMRCPLFCDWSCTASEMTNEKLAYAAVDSGAGHRASSACGNALEVFGLNWTDLVEKVDMKKGRNRNGPFDSGRLEIFISRAQEKYLLNEEEEALKEFRQFWAQRLTDAIKHERRVRIERHERLSDLMDKWDSKHGTPKKLRFDEDYDDDIEDEFAVKRQLEDDAEMEFEVVKDKYKVGTDMHKKACELLSDYNKQKSRTQRMRQGFDVVAEEKKEDERIKAWCSQLQSKGEEASGPLRPMDKESQEHFEKKAREREEKEADPERFWACKHLEDLVQKKKLEAETLIEGREREKREKEEEKEKADREYEAAKKSRKRFEEMRRKTRLKKEREKEEVSRRRAEESRYSEEERIGKRRALVKRLEQDWKKWEEEQKFEAEEEAFELSKMEVKVHTLERELELVRQAVSKAKSQAADRLESVVVRRQAYENQILVLSADNSRGGDNDGIRGNDAGVHDDDVRDDTRSENDVRDDCDDDEVCDDALINDNDDGEDDEEDGGGDDGDDEEQQRVGSPVRRVVMAESPDAEGEQSEEAESSVDEFEVHAEADIEDLDGIDVEDVVFEAEVDIEDSDGIAVEDVFDAEGYESMVDVTEPPPPKKRRLGLEYDINVLNTCNHSKIQYFVEGLFSLSNNKIGPDYLIELLKGIGSKERQHKISKHAFAKLKRKEERAEFVRLLMHEQVIFKEYLGTLNHLSQHNVSLIVVIDHIHHTGASKNVLKIFVRNFSKEEVEGVVKRICELSAMPVDESVDWLRNTGTFPHDYLADREPGRRMKKEWLLNLAKDLCELKGIAYPEEVCRLPFDGMIEPLANSFKRGEAEVEDFVNEVEMLCGMCAIERADLINQMSTLLPDAARFWSEKYGMEFGGQSSRGVTFESPRCNDNRELHLLGRGLQTVHVNSKTTADLALGLIARSKIVVLKITFTTHRFMAKSFPLWSIRTDKSVVILTLSLMQDHHIADFLRKFQAATDKKRLLMRDTTQMQEFSKKFNRHFSNLVDADKMAKDRGWTAGIWQAFCENMVGGELCRRASLIPSGARLSEEALSHEKIRLSLLYEFYAKFGEDIESRQAQPIPKRLLGKRPRPR